MFKKERYDGTFIRNLNFFTQITPYIKPARTDSVIVFEQEYNITKSLAYTQEKNVSFTQIFLYAALRTIATMPKMNRFVSGLRCYQRNRIAFSFCDEKNEQVTMSFSPLLTFESFCFKIQNNGSPFEKKEDLKINKILSVIKKLPRFFLKFLIWSVKFLDYHNGLPISFIDSLPYFSSIILTDNNGIDGNFNITYYHNFDVGNCGFFCNIGKINTSDSCSKVKMTFTFDNRITDPVYCSQALEFLRDLTENPEKLEEMPEWTTEQLVRLGLTEKELNNI